MNRSTKSDDESSANSTTTNVLVIGNIYSDSFVELASFPIPGGKHRILNIRESLLGGSAANFASGFAKASSNCSNSRVYLHSIVSSSDVGPSLLIQLEKKSINVDLCRKISGSHTGSTIVLLTPDDSTKLGLPGITSNLLSHLVSKEEIQNFRHVHLASVETRVLEKILDACQNLNRNNRNKRITLSLDIGASMLSHNSDQIFKLAEVLLSELDFVFLNQIALQHIFGIVVGQQGWIESIQRRISHRTSFLITSGEKGSHWISRDRHEFHPAFKTQVMNTVGAGDAFAAFFLFHHLVLGDSHALGKANLAAAIKIRAHGGCENHPNLEFLEKCWKDPTILTRNLVSKL